MRGRKIIESWAYEEKEFWFEGIERGTRSYLPDFRVTWDSGTIEYHEVKGYMDATSRTKLARMAKYHPTVKVRVIDAAWFRSANRNIAPLIPHWERGA